jgi:magnesium transporter
MVNVEDLTLYFLDNHPADAARVLQNVAPANGAALLDSVPIRLAVPVIRNLLPSYAARCFSQMDNERVSAIIRDLGPQQGSIILRHLSERQQESILGLLPTGTGLRLRLLLGYADNSVGAWMNPNALTFNTSTLVEDAVIHVRESGEAIINYVFVVDSEQRLQGIVRIANLIQANGKVPLMRIMERPAASVMARSPLASVHGHAGWNDFHELPVVERGNRFVGILPYSVTSQIQQTSAPVQTSMAGTASELVNVFLIGMFGILQNVLATGTDTSPSFIGREEKKNES